jgi:hypothetical protein
MDKYILILLLFSCVNTFENDIESIELTSTTGEKLYINTSIRGVGADHQYTGIYCKKDYLSDKDFIYGLEPFMYSFKNDTLNLIFADSVRYRVKEKFESIKIQYSVIINDEKWLLYLIQAEKNKFYHKVPNSK